MVSTWKGTIILSFGGIRENWVVSKQWSRGNNWKRFKNAKSWTSLRTPGISKGSSRVIGKRKMVRSFRYTQVADKRERGHSGICALDRDLFSCQLSVNHRKLQAWNLKHFISHHFSEFLKDIIINQCINISPFSKENIGKTLIGNDMFHVFQTIGANNVQWDRRKGMNGNIKIIRK